MFCQKCVSKVEGTAFCPSCGTGVGTTGGAETGAPGGIISGLGKFDRALIAIGIILIFIWFFVPVVTIPGLRGLTWNAYARFFFKGNDPTFIVYIPLIMSGLLALAAIIKKIWLGISVAALGIIIHIGFIALFSEDGYPIGAYLPMAIVLYVTYIIVAIKKRKQS